MYFYSMKAKQTLTIKEPLLIDLARQSKDFNEILFMKGEHEPIHFMDKDLQRLEYIRIDGDGSINVDWVIKLSDDKAFRIKTAKATFGDYHYCTCTLGGMINDKYHPSGLDTNTHGLDIRVMPGDLRDEDGLVDFIEEVTSQILEIYGKSSKIDELKQELKAIDEDINTTQQKLNELKGL